MSKAAIAETAPDFTAHAHPVLAVACPDCRARAGAWCKRPSAHKAMDLHASRKAAADAAFIAAFGPQAWIERLQGGAGWRVHPTGCTAPDHPAQLALDL